MIIAFVAAALIFLAIVILVAGLWWESQTDRSLRARLVRPSMPQPQAQLLKPAHQGVPQGVAGLLSRTGLPHRFATLASQGGYPATAGDLILVMVGFAAVGGAAAWLKTGGFFRGVLVGLMAGAAPVVYLLYKRSRRLTQFATQLPDALDMVTGAIRAGNALSGAIKLVGEEMPNPIGEELRRVDEEIRLGVEPGEALLRLQGRIPTEDVRFFCTAIRIQRGAGGNLAEILERLAEVIRERFKILSHARVLASQHRWTAILVGISPIVFGVNFQILNPGFFDPLFTDPMGPTLILGGLILEVVGFYTIWRIAKIKV